ncbi:MAG: transcriptional regulator, partial [Clostridium sp.]|nr:transcriptional regulator [Clostridium sp.]
QEIGPGITKPHQEPDRDNEETKESDKGPGAGEHTKPAEKPTSAPTTEAPDTPGPGTGGQDSAPSDPGTTGAGAAGPGV